MQLSLVQFESIAEGGAVAPERPGSGMPGQEEGEELKPIIIDLSEDAAPAGERGLFHRAVEFLIISISSRVPKLGKRA